MADPSFYENCWSQLLKSSRSWQVQNDINQLLSDVCRVTHQLLSFDLTAAFVLERAGVRESARWPNTPPESESEARRQAIASDVIHAGRSAFVQRPGPHGAFRAFCAPLTASREILGALYVEADHTMVRLVDDRDQQFVEMCALQAAAALEHVRLYQSAVADPLTGLFCHRHFRLELEQAVRRSTRTEKPVTLLLMDLDHFKELNDTCGHDAGNDCLVQVTGIMRSLFRTTDVLGRFGGDEFEALLLDTGSEESAIIAERLRTQIAKLKLPNKLHVTATIGLASHPQNSNGAHALFLRADAAMYAAKVGGRNRIESSKAAPEDKAGASQELLERTARLMGEAPETSASMPHTPRPGAVEMVDGHIVVQRLGMGSSGEVLLAVQPGLERQVALKRPLTTNLSFEQTQQFEQEAKVTASLNHPGVVPVHTIGRDQDTRRYYTMRPLNGKTLQQVLDERQRGVPETLHSYTHGRLLEILQRVADTIAYAHKQNVLHMDLTPENIMIGEFGEVSVIDWGRSGSFNFGKSAKSSWSLLVVGSPAFLAPELVQGHKTNGSAACDVFALGVLLYHVLTDDFPFRRGTTAESLESLVAGELIAPDARRPERGIDPALSRLCVNALDRDPKRRVSAADFAARLASYNRRELEWTTITFGDTEHPVRTEDWRMESGPWRLENGEWISAENAESILLLNKSIPGSFRFVFEGWAETANCEISLVGHRPKPGTINYYTVAGYWFQLGAENNTVTKFCHFAHDALVDASIRVQPGRRYRIEMEYQDQEGYVHCALDGKRIFSFRELFPFPGSELGFVSYSAGVHFRPIELSSQNWSHQIPAIRAADRLLQKRNYADALECYLEIAENIPDRLQGLEAQLKFGFCQASVGNFEAACKSMHELKDTSLEPHALAEEAMFEIYPGGAKRMGRMLELFSELARRFPQSHAYIRLYDALAQLPIRFRDASGSRQEKLDFAIRLNDVALSHAEAPGHSKIQCQLRKFLYQTYLGQWRTAQEECLSFGRRLTEQQRESDPHTSQLLVLAIANNRPDLLPKRIEVDDLRGMEDWSTGLLLHAAIHLNDFDGCLSRLDVETFPVTAARLYLARGEIVRAQERLDTFRKAASLPVGGTGFIASVWNVADTLDQKLIEQYFCATEGLGHEHAEVVQFGRTLVALYQGRLEAAARSLAEVRNVQDRYGKVHGVCVLQALLGSLNLLPSDTLAALREKLEYNLSGTMLDLARIFLGEREPVPNDLWPAPGWRPEWRLWLAIWLEAKGKMNEARAIVEPCRDPRYGLTHSQPGIEALLGRIGSKL